MPDNIITGDPRRPSIPDHADEVQFHRLQRDRAIRSLSPLAGQAGTERRQWLDDYDRLIRAPTDADYRVPEHFARTMGATARLQLTGLLAELRKFRTQLIGLSTAEACVLYNGDEFVALLREEFDVWMMAQVKQRLSAPSFKDRGDPFAKCIRIARDFGDWFQGLVLGPGCGHIVVLAHLNRKLFWLLQHETGGKYLVRDDRGIFKEYAGLDEATCRAFERNLWTSGWEGDALVAGLAALTRGLGARTPTDPTAVRQELRVLAADLMEMKGLLARSYRPEDHVLKLGDGSLEAFATWTWDVGAIAGLVLLGPDAATVVREANEYSPTFGVGIGLEGVPQHVLMPWLDLGPEVAQWALGVLRPLHAHLLDLWDKAPRPPPSGVAGGDAVATDEAVAVACEVLARADHVEDDAAADPAPRSRVPAVRTVTLFALLERRFECEIKRSKGSEISIYRPGRHMYTLPGHQRNARYPSFLIRALLHRLGINAVEFCAAVGR